MAPSLTHELLVELFRARPVLAVELVRDVLGVSVPEFAQVRVESAEVTDVAPASRYADFVVVLYDEHGTPLLAIIVEVQLRVDLQKRTRWLAYVANLGDRLDCPVELLVVTVDDSVARWAAARIPIGRLGWMHPLVLPLSAVPPIEDRARAARDPELALLSALAHAPRAEAEAAERLADVTLFALGAVAETQRALYYDLFMTVAGPAARRAMETQMLLPGYRFQTPWLREAQEKGLVEGEARGLAEGEARGLVGGRALALLAVLEKRGLAVAADQRAHIEACRDVAALDQWLRRAVTAATTADVLAP